MTAGPFPATAQEVRERNQALDDELRGLAAQAAGPSLHRSQGGGEWTVAQLLGHLGEFPRFFAADLGAWLDASAEGADPGRLPELADEADLMPAVGRTHEHPERLAAVEAAGRPGGGDGEAQLAGLRDGLGRGFAELAAVLQRLTDAHLNALTVNRKYGPEPLTAYLDRYILAHKSGHAEQFRRAL